MRDPTFDFCAEMSSAGIAPPDQIVADGRIHRFHDANNDRKGARNGWYVLFSDKIAAGAFGSWKLNLERKWSSVRPGELSHEDRLEFQFRISEAKRQAELARTTVHHEAAERARHIWERSQPARSDHPYLHRKQIGAHCARQSDGVLVIPVSDISGQIHSLQFITRRGEKRFLSGGKLRGCFCGIGNIEGAKKICIAEGFATAASIQEATGLPVAIAFNAGNLMPVAAQIRKTFPDATIVICADNDTNTPGNPGVTKATEAARAIDALLAIPNFAGK